MGIIGELFYDITEMLEQDRNPVDIARILDIPITWVYEVNTEVNGETSE